LNWQPNEPSEDSLKRAVESDQFCLQPERKKVSGNRGSKQDSSGLNCEFSIPSVLTGPNYKSLRDLTTSLQIADPRDTSVLPEDKVYLGTGSIVRRGGDGPSRDPLERFTQIMERREGNSAKSHNSQGQHNWSKEAINEGFSGHCSRELKSDLSQLSHVESKLSRGQVTPEGSKGYLHRILGDDPTTNLFVDWPLWESRDEISSEDLKNQGLEPQIDFKNLNGDYNDALDGPQAPSNDYSKHQRTGRNHRREKSPFHAEEERMKASLLSHSASDTDSYLNQSSSKDNIDPQNSMQKQSLQGTPLTIPSKEVQRKKRNLESIQNILRESSLRKKFGNILSSLKTSDKGVKVV
jgi:hypothetical protein